MLILPSLVKISWLWACQFGYPLCLALLREDNLCLFYKKLSNFKWDSGKAFEKLYSRYNFSMTDFARLLEYQRNTRWQKSIKEVSVCWSDLFSDSLSAPEHAHQDVLSAEPTAMPAPSQVPHPEMSPKVSPEVPLSLLLLQCQLWGLLWPQLRGAAAALGVGAAAWATTGTTGPTAADPRALTVAASPWGAPGAAEGGAVSPLEAAATEVDAEPRRADLGTATLPPPLALPAGPPLLAGGLGRAFELWSWGSLCPGIQEPKPVLQTNLLTSFPINVTVLGIQKHRPCVPLQCLLLHKPGWCETIKLEICIPSCTDWFFIPTSFSHTMSSSPGSLNASVSTGLVQIYLLCC